MENKKTFLILSITLMLFLFSQFVLAESNATTTNPDLYSKINSDFNCDGRISLEDGTIITDLWQDAVILNSQLVAEKSQ